MSQETRTFTPGPTLGGYQKRASVLESSAALARPPASSKPITETRHLSLELKKESTSTDAGPAPSNRYTIYDLKSVKREILTVFDAAENGDNRAITKFSKGKNFDVDAKV